MTCKGCDAQIDQNSAYFHREACFCARCSPAAAVPAFSSPELSRVLRILSGMRATSRADRQRAGCEPLGAD
jgi:hypothetical protein